MKNNLKRKFIWINVWEIEEHEAWFSDMAQKGWHLVKMNMWTAVFKKGEPEDANFRCDTFKVNHPVGNERIEQYQEAGWEHVASRNQLQVFKEMNGQTKPVDRTETIQAFKRNIDIRGIVTIVLTIILFGILIGKLQIDPIRNFIEEGFIESLVFIYLYSYICWMMIQGMIHLSKLEKRLQTGEASPKVDYKKKLKRKMITGTILQVVILAWVVSVFANLIEVITEERHPKIPSRDLPVVKMSDILNHSNFNRTTMNGLSEGNLLNYYTVNSSILVPNQYELHEDIEVPGVLEQDGTTTYSPSLRSYRYDVRTAWLAKKFTNELREKNSRYNENYQLVQQSRFDELWISTEGRKSAFIARFENHVFYIVYYGKKPIEGIIEQAYKKINMDRSR